MPYSVSSLIGRVEKISLSASIMQALERAHQMAELVLKSKVTIVHTTVTAGIIERRAYHSDSPYQTNPDLFLWRSVRISMVVAKQDLGSAKTLKAEVILDVTSKDFNDVNKTLDLGEARKWTVSMDRNYIQIDNLKPVCLIFERIVGEDYKPEISPDEVSSEILRQFGFL